MSPPDDRYEIDPPASPGLMDRIRRQPKVYAAWAVALLFLFLVGMLIITNVALYGQNQELIAALRLNSQEPGVWAPGKTNAVAEARQQATVNEQHIYLLDEIQAQQLQLIASLTNRVNRSAAIIRELESRQVEQEAETRQWASISGGAGGPGAPAAAGVDQSTGTASGEEVDPASGEAGDVESVLARAFQGIQIDELFSIDNPVFSGIIVWDYDNQSGVMQLSNLPSLPPDFRYQLWVLDPNFDDFVAGGTFDIPANVPQFEYTFRPGGDIREAVGYAVTAEDLAGTAAPRGPTVVSTRNLLGKL
jgi:hypothetical protein